MKQLLILLFLLCSICVSAQDVIVMKDGTTILSKVLEVGQSEIKYKKHENLDGPTYTISKSELQAINYQNGAKDTFSASVREENRYLPNNQNDGEQTMNDKALLQLDAAANYNSSMKKSKILKTTGWIGGATFAACGIVFIALDDYPISLGIGIIGLGAAWTTGFLLAANHQKRRNQMLQSSIIYQHNFQFSNGSSLSIGADMLSDRTLGTNTVGLGLRYNF